MTPEIFLKNLVPDTVVALQLARFLVTFALGVLLVRLVLMPLTRRAAKRRSADKKSQHSLQNFAAIAGLFLVFIVSLQAANFGGLTTVIGAIAAAATVAFGFGMRDQVSNVVAGIFIHLDNPFVRNDYIKVNEVEGVVEEIKMHATMLNGEKDEKTMVPNSVLTQNPVRNFTRGNRTKTVIELKIEPGKLEDAREAIMDVVSGTERVLEKPAPEFKISGYEDSKAVVEAEYWIKDSENVSEVKKEVLQSFNSSAPDLFAE